jgi:hypothetical protein
VQVSEEKLAQIPAKNEARDGHRGLVKLHGVSGIIGVVITRRRIVGMTTLLERAIAEIEKLSPDIQDAIAARLLAELADETQWQTQFAATTDEQWQKMVVAVQAEIDEEKTMSLEQFLIEIEKR